jgi:hypothetical protein
MMEREFVADLGGAAAPHDFDFLVRRQMSELLVCGLEPSCSITAY